MSGLPTHSLLARQDTGAVAVPLTLLLHVVPLLHPDEFVLWLYLRARHLELGGQIALDGLAEVVVTDVDLAAYLGWSLKTLQRWRKRHAAAQTALRVLIPKVERVLDPQSPRCPIVIGFRYHFYPEPQLDEAIWAELRVTSQLSGLPPLEERRRVLVLAQAAKQRHLDGTRAYYGDKKSPLEGQKVAPRGDKKSPLKKSRGDKMAYHRSNDMMEPHDHYRGIELTASDSERLAYERWLYDELHRLGPPLDQQAFRAFFRQFRRVGEGPAYRLAGEVRELTRSGRIANPVGYLMQSLKNER